MKNRSLSKETVRALTVPDKSLAAVVGGAAGTWTRAKPVCID